MNVSYHSVGMTVQSSNKVSTAVEFGSLHGAAVPPADHAEYFTCYSLCAVCTPG